MEGNSTQRVTLYTRLVKFEGFPKMGGTHESILCEFAPFSPVPRLREQDGRRLICGPDRRIEVELPPEIDVDQMPGSGYIEIRDPVPRIETTSSFGGTARPISAAADIYHHVWPALVGMGPAPEGFRVLSNVPLEWVEG